jgi:spore maturation protein CgeB
VGTAFLSRLKFFSQMNFDGISMVLGGNGWDSVPPEYQHLWKYLGHRPDQCVDNTEVADQYRHTKIGMNLYRQEGEEAQQGKGYSMGPREIEMAACGLFFLRDSRPESDDVFGMLPKISSPAEAEELIRYYLKHEKQREKLADQAYEAVKDYTFDKRCEFVFDIMSKVGIV